MKKNISIIITLCLLLTLNSYGQPIRALFTQSVDNTISPITDAVTAANIEDTICAYINMSTTTLDIAVWDNGSAAIVNALNSAYNRGVVVRYISSSNSLNSALTGLSSNIPVLERQASLTVNVMHNKIVVVDNAIVLSGSMNYGQGSMFDDYNNFIIIHDATLTQNYTIEFNEMWGGSGAQPNLTNSKFGPAKTNNTQHNFTIGGIAVESYFSPTDGTASQIVNAINTADHTLDVAMFTFTDNDLGAAVIAAKNRGVAVRAIIENVSYIGSEYSGLLSNGIDVRSHANVPYDFHHKYCIIDANAPTSNPTVVTGSHNWTNSAEDDNDENTLIIHDQLIANQYLEEFSQRFSELSPTNVVELSTDSGYIIYPNPAEGVIILSSPKGFNNAAYKITNCIGQVVAEQQNINGQNYTINIEALSGGVYFVIIEQDNVISQAKLVKQ